MAAILFNPLPSARRAGPRPGRAVVLVPDGVGVRNFVIGPFLDELTALMQVHVFHSIPAPLLPEFQTPRTQPVQWTAFPYFPASRPVDFLASTLAYAHMYSLNTVAMQRRLNRRIPGPLRSRLLTRVKRGVGKTAAKLDAVETMDQLHASVAGRSAETAYYRRLFQETQPSVVFASNQAPQRVAPPVLAARQLGIPTATFIFGWDNLSSKARIAAPFDYFLVWSEYMRDELLRYYPLVTPARVEVVGTPQFETYADPSLLWDRQEFFARIGANPRNPLLCYSGGDAGSCPEDPRHVAVLMELIRSGRIAGNPTVLVRPSPVDTRQRYQETLRQYPEVLFHQPKWLHTDSHWSGVLPTMDDLQFLINLTRHTDLNLNLGSTMTLDFGLNDTPVVNVAFDCSSPPVFGMPVFDYYYNYEHLRPVLECGASRVARSPEQLADHVNAYLRDPGLDRDGRRRFAQMHVKMPLAGASARISEALARIAENGKPSQR